LKAVLFWPVFDKGAVGCAAVKLLTYAGIAYAGMSRQVRRVGGGRLAASLLFSFPHLSRSVTFIAWPFLDAFWNEVTGLRKLTDGGFSEAKLKYQFCPLCADFRFDRVKEMDAEVVSRLLQGMLRMSWNPVIEPQYSAMVGAFVETPANDLDPLLAEKLQAAGSQALARVQFEFSAVCHWTAQSDDNYRICVSSHFFTSDCRRS
jgi:hypothetical protein